ncbi:MAG: SpoIIE family protein phosphatase [Candidatus Sedimenticola sp. PURPLELP]
MEPIKSGINGKALVAETDIESSSILTAYLEESGYEVIYTTDGSETVESFKTSSPDIIFLNIHLPVLDGFETAIKIREIEENHLVPIIFLSLSDDEQTLSTCIEAGGDDFLSKPLSKTIIKSKIKALERTRSLHQEISNLYSQMRKDEELAETLFSGAVVAENVALDQIPTLLRPAELFSGDVLLTAYAPSGDLNVLLGDFTGHGLSAALGALPMSEVFRAMTVKGFAPHQILSGINRKLLSLLPTGKFFALQFVSISNKLDFITVCNCGMPDILLLDGESGEIKQRFSSNSIPLAISPDIDFKQSVVHSNVAEGDRILLVSDGVSEARNPENQYFGQARLEQAITNKPADQPALSSIAKALDEFCQKAPQDDDISLAEIPCSPSILSNWETLSSTSLDAGPGEKVGDIAEFTLKLTGSRLQQADPVPLVINHIQEMEGLHTHRRLLFTVLTELYINALDHGVLSMDSRMKSSPEGFTKYFTERENRLADLASGFVKIQVRTQPMNNGGRMSIRLEDSGNGFNYSEYQNRTGQSETELSGRGILLLQELCESVSYESPGNKVEVVYTWSEE